MKMMIMIIITIVYIQVVDIKREPLTLTGGLENGIEYVTIT